MNVEKNTLTVLNVQTLRKKQSKQYPNKLNRIVGLPGYQRKLHLKYLSVCSVVRKILDER